MTQPQGAVATPVPPLIALPCLMLGFGPVPQRSLLNLAGGESVPTGVSWDPSLPLRDLGTVAALRAAHLRHAAFQDTAITVIHCLLVLLTVLNHLAGSRGLPLRLPGVSAKASWSYFSERQQRKQRSGAGLGVGIRPGRWVVRLLAGNKAAVDLPQRPHVPGQAGF